MKRLFIVLIKYIPIIQMVGMLFNNILYCFSDIYIISYILDFIIGNSITTTFLLYVCSYVFGFCKWHRFIITANIINLLIANLDAYYRIPISDIQLLIVYHFIAAIFICISTYIHIKNNHNERKIKDIINSYKEANVSSTELYNGVMSLHNIFDYVEKQDNKIFWKSMRKLHESIKGAHFDEEYAKWQVSTMYHTADNGKICKGEIYNYDCAKNVFDKYVRNINSSITVWDVYVAINAQYHDYIRLYSEWFRNINKNELDNKIIESAITFYFKDEDSGSTKTWNYFKTAN